MQVSLYGVLIKINRAELCFLVQITLNMLSQIISFQKCILIGLLTQFCIILCKLVFISNDCQILKSNKRFFQFVKAVFADDVGLLVMVMEMKNTCS